MHILGLTGSIATGKSTAAAMLKRLGIPVYDADATVHALLGTAGPTVSAIAELFPGTVVDGIIDRAALGARVFRDLAGLRQLEGILHPLVRYAEQRFLRHAAIRHTTLVVLDVPLLFETCGEQRCDATIAMTAPRFLQTQRALRRAGMTPGRLEAIRARQTPEAEKRRLAGFVISSGLGRGLTRRRLIQALKVIRTYPACHWPPCLLPRMPRRGCRHA